MIKMCDWCLEGFKSHGEKIMIKERIHEPFLCEFCEEEVEEGYDIKFLEEGDINE